MAKASHLGKETALASIADSILSKLDKQDVKKAPVKLCQRKVEQSFKIPYFSEMSVRCTRSVSQSLMPQHYEDFE